MIDKDKLIAQIQRFYKNKEAFILLESQMKNHPASKTTFIAVGSVASISVYGNEICVIEEGIENIFQGHPWEALKEFRSVHTDWCFGFLGYDLKNHTEKLFSSNESLVDAPDLFFFVPEVVMEIDSNNELRSLKGELPKDLPRTIFENEITLELQNQISKAEYLRRISSAQSQIHEGDYYEINLSHPLEFKMEGSAWDLYQKMKDVGPVPFGSYIRVEGFEICSASPERFLSKQGNKIISQPIKGTVKVSNLFEIQSFETVHQMVSTVKAEIKQGEDSVDVLKACFPMGSMTGAPKVAAMKAIEEIEDYKRGIYSGAIGYFTPANDFDFSVVIRTALVNGEKVVYPVGGAITSDSDPEMEWEETLVKAKAITKLIN